LSCGWQVTTHSVVHSFQRSCRRRWRTCLRRSGQRSNFSSAGGGRERGGACLRRIIYDERCSPKNLECGDNGPIGVDPGRARLALARSSTIPRLPKLVSNQARSAAAPEVMPLLQITCILAAPRTHRRSRWPLLPAGLLTRSPRPAKAARLCRSTKKCLPAGGCSSNG